MGGTATGTVTYYPVAGAMRVNSTLYFVLKDNLGSASVVTDSTGTTVGEDRFYPFGETRFTTGNMQTDKLFTGQRQIMGLGIYHYGARFYSPKLGRFLSADTIVPGYANPQRLNRYSYVLNNPIRYRDPSGHKPCDADGKGGCIVSSEPFTKGQVVSRLRRYGVRVSGNWSYENAYAAFAGVDLVGTKLAQSVGGSAEDAFKKAVTSVNFEWNDAICGKQTDRCYADANSFPTIKFYSKYWAGLQDDNGNNLVDPIPLATPALTPKVVIHELGHGFDSRTGRAFNQALINKDIIDKTGFGVVVGGGGQHEVTADLFTNYILDTFTGPSTNGTDLQQFMNTNIVTWVNIASTP